MNENIYIILETSLKSNRYLVFSYEDDTIFIGNSYDKKYLIRRAIKAFRRAVTDPHKYSNLKNQFILRAGNHREIGRSPKMKPAQLERAMELLVKHGAEAPIIERELSGQGRAKRPRDSDRKESEVNRKARDQ